MTDRGVSNGPQVTRVHAPLAQEFVRSTLQQTLESLSPSTPWSHLEVGLWLLFTLGEGLPESLTRDKTGHFQQLMMALLSSAASSCASQRQPQFIELATIFAHELAPVQ
jgi:hypothetical protein